MRRVLFITAASHTHGQGHYFRTLRIASEAANLAEVVVFCNQPMSTQEVRDYDLPLIPFDLNSPESLFCDFELHENDVFWFDIPDDCYYLISYFSEYSQKIVSINMFEARSDSIVEDVYIYPCFRKTNCEFNERYKTTFMSGSDFIIVDDKFFFEPDSKKTAGRILVSMGGADPMGVTIPLIKQLNGIMRSDLNFRVVLPKTVKKRDVVNSLSIRPTIELFDFDGLDFATALKQSQYAVINGGITRYECIAAETYSIAISMHDVQYGLTALSTAYGFGCNFGVINEFELTELVSYIEGLSLTSVFPGPVSNVVGLRQSAALKTFNTVMEVINSDESEIPINN
ncbi:hypothetical protein N9C91_02635 [Luminiphilus sp.]|nr:hypothetical protein [Luminiphilus sp.]